MTSGTPSAAQRLDSLHRTLAKCQRCPKMIGPVVYGAPVLSRIYLLGQAPGPHEGKFGRPFAWTAGKTMFGWFGRIGVDEALFRSRVYMSAVARCFPGKAPGGGDRKPDPTEIAACGEFVEAELAILEPHLLLPVGTLAIEQVLGRKVPLVEVVGRILEVEFHGARCEAICLPHPSGASTWHRKEPGIGLLAQALEMLSDHPAWKRTFGARGSRPA